ncbi:hypothetical protein GCM10027429_26450 [Marivirga atlantica]|jgi:hypothetical protein|uniref:PorV/PorQ family protein n=1 Tax=Marivirga atlantica TaxID=1548457 RepID=A0A937AGC1_9BACT|nr:hypothetical protein [Marivirga atlantica]MBL0766246.1 hypothetical protein [Marivirga atlantica]
MQKTVLLLLVFYFVLNGLAAQSIFEPLGARNIALANTATTISDIWSGFHNPAGISKVDVLTSSVFFQNKYNLEGFNSMAAIIASPIPSGSLAIGVNRFGDGLYNEHRVSAAYGSQIGIIQIGGRASYLQYFVQGFGTATTYSLDFGVIASLTKTLTIGANAYNISQSVISEQDEEEVPTLLMLGIQYKPVEYFFINTEIEKNLNMPAFVKLGLEYTITERFFLRTGIQSDTFESFYGFGMKFFGFRCDYALSLHQELGISNAISLQYKIQKQ